MTVRLEVDGVAVAASTGGAPLDRSRPLLVLVHGAGMDHVLWTAQSRWFARHGWSVLAVDLPGHGGSGGKPATTIDECGSWLLEVVVAAGWEQAALAGHSLGAFVALRAAALAPDAVTHLVLVATAATMPVNPELLSAAEAGDPRAVDLVISWSLTPADRLGGHPTPGMWMTGSGIRLMRRVDLEALGADLVACDRHSTALADAAAVRCPALLVCGELDRMTPAAKALPLARALREATTVVIPGAGHLVMMDHCDELTDAMADFLGFA